MDELKPCDQDYILHIDMDCFYAQVESRRLDIPMDVPLGVQQWHSLIAVNYAARQHGVKRGDLVVEAKKKCKDLKLVHVETIGDNRSHSDHDRSTQKVSLRRYRLESIKILNIMRSFPVVCERVSIDEAYLDITKEVNRRSKHSPCPTLSSDTYSIGLEDANDLQDIKLRYAAQIAFEIRQEIWKKLQYTSSCGIANNKLISKIASAYLKPNKQTIIPVENLRSFLFTLPYRKIRGFGRKLGDQIEEWQSEATTAGDLQKYSLQELQEVFNEKSAQMIFYRCRGIDSSVVKPVEALKSFGVTKEFRPPCDLKKIEYWVSLLTLELQDRLEEDSATNHRSPKCITVLTKSGNSTQKAFTTTVPYIKKTTELNQVILSFMYSNKEELFPCKCLLLSINSFVTTATSSSIVRFLQPVKKINQSNPPELKVNEVKDGTSEESSSGWVKESHFKCQKCKKEIPIDNRQEHEDYHIAKEMEKEFIAPKRRRICGPIDRFLV